MFRRGLSRLAMRFKHASDRWPPIYFVRALYPSYLTPVARNVTLRFVFCLRIATLAKWPNNIDHTKYRPLVLVAGVVTMTGALMDVPCEVEKRVTGIAPLSTSTSLGSPQKIHEEKGRRREGWGFGVRNENERLDDRIAYSSSAEFVESWPVP